MNTPGEKSTTTSVPAQVTVPIDAIVDLTVARMNQRRTASFRWAVIALIGLATLMIGAFGLERKRLEKSIEERLRADAEERASNRIGYLRDSDLFESARQVSLGRTSIVLGVAEAVRLALPRIDQTALYRIEAIAEGEGLDPLLYLYQLRGTGTSVDAIDFNDDFNGLNSRIERELAAGESYYVEVQELDGAPGAIGLVVERIGG
jgi:hypothetical protein